MRRAGDREGTLGVAEESRVQAARLPEPFEDFYRREFRPVVGLAFALSGSRSGAEDIAQEAFLAAHRSWDRIGLFQQPGAWVRRVVANMSVSSVRRRVAEAKALARLARRREPTLPELSADDDEFWRAVRSLPRRQAQAVSLRYLEDLPLAQIGEILGLSEGTVKAHLFAARKTLAERLRLDEVVEA